MNTPWPHPAGSDDRLEPVEDSAGFPGEAIRRPSAPGRLLLRDAAETLIMTLLAFWLAQSLVQGFRVTGTSMQPTLQDGQFLFVNKISYVLDAPQRGDIVVLWPPYPSEERLIKRIIGLPGDTIEINDQNVVVNGIRLDEPYINARPTYNGTWTVQEGHYFVLGDNRNSSHDSHRWSEYLPAENIVGKAMVIYWPVSAWEFIPHVEVLANEH